MSRWNMIFFLACVVEVSEAKECEVCEKVVEDIRKSVFKKLPSEHRLLLLLAPPCTLLARDSPPC